MATLLVEVGLAARPDLLAPADLAEVEPPREQTSDPAAAAVVGELRERTSVLAAVGGEEPLAQTSDLAAAAAGVEGVEAVVSPRTQTLEM